jgi:hypothetical protein
MRQAYLLGAGHVAVCCNVVRRHVLVRHALRADLRCLLSGSANAARGSRSGRLFFCLYFLAEEEPCVDGQVVFLPPHPHAHPTVQALYQMAHPQEATKTNNGVKKTRRRSIRALRSRRAVA